MEFYSATDRRTEWSLSMIPARISAIECSPYSLAFALWMLILLNNPLWPLYLCVPHISLTSAWNMVDIWQISPTTTTKSQASCLNQNQECCGLENSSLSISSFRHNFPQGPLQCQCMGPELSKPYPFSLFHGSLILSFFVVKRYQLPSHLLQSLQ